MISAEQKQKAIRLYKNKSLTLPEIANLTGISTARLGIIYKQAFEFGILKPRREEFALKARTPNGQGKGKYVSNGKKRGNPNFKAKFTPEQEMAIAKEYYEKQTTAKELMQKYSLHPMQLQRIRETYGDQYAQKKNPLIRPVLQFDKQGNFIAEFESGHKASIETNINYHAINWCCNGHQKSAGGYVWKFKDNENNI